MARGRSRAVDPHPHRPEARVAACCGWPRSVSAHRAVVRWPLAGRGSGATMARGCTSVGRDPSIA
eukprot:15485088-Alexandrium_andersonii.AAC.1